MMSTPAITVTRLRVAPVKALAAVEPQQVHLDAEGVAEDRRLFLLDAAGDVVTLRRHPGLARVVPALDLAGGVLTVTLPDGTAASSPLAAAAGRVTASLFGKEREGDVLPGEVADALGALVGEPLRVVLSARIGVGWDEGPVSLLGRASAHAVGAPDTTRFRMLVEIDGTGPYEEDSWAGRQLRVGGALLDVSHPLQRCVVINSDPATGLRDWPGLTTLAAVRGRDWLTLGVIARVARPGTVRVGDAAQLAG